MRVEREVAAVEGFGLAEGLRFAHEPVELDERRLAEVDFVGELLRLHLALDAPRLVTERLPLLARDPGHVRRQVEGTVLLRVPERADVPEADGRPERLGHHHVVDQDPDRRVVAVDRAAGAVLDRQGAVHPDVRDVIHADHRQAERLVGLMALRYLVGVGRIRRVADDKVG